MISCSEILLHLVSSCRYDPNLLYILSESSLHQCLWQLLLTSIERFQLIGVSLLRMILSISHSLHHYLRRSVLSSIDITHPLNNRDKSFVSPWDDVTENHFDNENERSSNGIGSNGIGSNGIDSSGTKNGSGLKNAHIRYVQN